eukprot:gene11477-34193_t
MALGRLASGGDLDARLSCRSAPGVCVPPRIKLAPLRAAPAAKDLLTQSVEAQAIISSLEAELKGLDRGIFGVPAAKKAAINELVQKLEAQNAIEAPVDNLDLVAGDWKLLYSSIVITRTKLGLREFIKLGDFIQQIDPASSSAVNRIDFSVSGLGMIKGGLTIRASYTAMSPQRVGITFQEATLAPAQLQTLFEQNLDLLLTVFNPEGHLDITYLDDSHRVGRDDKGNVFFLERVTPLA